MKKRVLLTTITALICLSISGCGIYRTNSATTGTSQNTAMPNGSSSTTTTGSAAAPEKQIIKMGETITFDNFEITLNSAETQEKIKSSEYTAFKPDEGNVYITLNLTVKNIDTEASEFLSTFPVGSDIRAKLTYGSYEFQESNLLGYSEDIHSTFLNPLSSKTGVVAFEIAEDIADLNKLTFVLYNNKEEYNFSLASLESNSDTEQTI